MGTWSRNGNVLTLKSSVDLKILDLMNGFSRSSTRGIPDIRLDYSPEHKTMTWVTGQPRFKTKRDIVMKRQ